MTEKKYLLVSMDDERIKKISEALGNKTCKKIIDFLADEKEASETDISEGIKLPLNTVEYNIKKLAQAELIEKTTNFFWSKKGKKIPVYKISNKSIVISPKKSNLAKVRSFLPVALIAGATAVLIRNFVNLTEVVGSNRFASGVKDQALATAEQAPQIVMDQGNIFINQPSPAWLWFLGGAVFALFIFAILNWRKLNS